MNGDPTAEQQRFQNDLREMGCIITGSNSPDIHHIFGSKWKAKGFKKPGEWLVVPLNREDHADIAAYSFDAERGLFLAALRKYELEYNCVHPIPPMLIQYYINMRHRKDITRGLSIA